MSDEFTQFRSPTLQERTLINAVAQRWVGRAADWTSSVLVARLDDGGMGSLRLRVEGERTGAQRFGECAAEYSFVDCDGVQVIASLYLDEHGVPFELDMWKTDFSPLRRVDTSDERG